MQKADGNRPFAIFWQSLGTLERAQILSNWKSKSKHAQTRPNFQSVQDSMKNTEKLRKWIFSKPGKIILWLVVTLILLRIFLPYIMLHYANKELSELSGYYGHINNLSVALYRGAYTLDSIYINKVEEKSGKQNPFFSSKSVDLSLDWGSLVKGKLAGEVILIEPDIQFTQNKVELQDVAKDSSSFRELLHDFMPIQINRTEIKHGRIVYTDNTKAPKIEIEMTDIDALALNLKNTYNKKEVLPATLHLTSRVHGGDLLLNMRLNPLSEHTDFDFDLEVLKVELSQLNPFFKEYANLDVNKGSFTMYMEAATKDNEFVGYVKPFMEDLDVLSLKGQDKDDGFFQKIWEGIAGFGGKILRNQRTDKIATKIPLSGTIGGEQGIQSNVLIAVYNIVKNAFFKALNQNLDDEISIRNILKE